MPATILQQAELPNLPSASGIEVVGNTVYIIGDDSPFLYHLDTRTLTPNRQLTLFETTHFSTGRIPKGRKPDLECLTALTVNGEAALLACGSGATALREQGFWVGLEENATVYPLSLSGLYAALRPFLPSGTLLNLEAAAATATELLLFQRTLGSAQGVVFRLPLAEVVAYLRKRTSQVPPIQLHYFTLPNINGRFAGFSGAAAVAEKILVTASVEDTLDPIADGEVLGSFVGMLDLTWTADRPIALTQLVLPDGQPYLGKVEGVAVRSVQAPGQYELLLVTDDDQGGSTILTVAFS